jgi:hypothetical protein
VAGRFPRSAQRAPAVGRPRRSKRGGRTVGRPDCPRGHLLACAVPERRPEKNVYNVDDDKPSQACATTSPPNCRRMASRSSSSQTSAENVPRRPRRAPHAVPEGCGCNECAPSEPRLEPRQLTTYVFGFHGRESPILKISGPYSANGVEARLNAAALCPA